MCKPDHDIVDDLDRGGGPKRAEENRDVGEGLHDRRQALASLRVAAEIDDPFAGLDHAGRSADLAIDENGALLRQRRDVIFLHRHGVRTELDDDLTWLRRTGDPARAVHDLVKRFV